MNFQNKLLACLGICCLGLFGCEKATFLLQGDNPTISLDGDRAYINGTLGKAFHKKFEDFVADNPNVKEFVLENVPGSIDDDWNIKTCSLLYEQGITTILLSNSEIASGGVDLFMAGKHRALDSGAKIGVHSWSDGAQDGTDYPKNDPVHDLYIDLFTYINVDTNFYWFTLDAAASEDLHWMTAEEIERFGLVR